MRVVAGQARGRLLRAPAGDAVRPTRDRVREAVFAMLTSAGALEGAVVADLFAGSGAMGIEALSRGAAEATFVDSDRRSVEAVWANLEVLGPLGAGRARVVRAEVLGWLEAAAGRGAGLPGPAGAAGPFDLVLCDPPYDFARWDELLGRLGPLLRAGEPAAVVVAEAAAAVQPPPGWRALKSRSYGTTVVTLASPEIQATSPKGTE